MTPGHSPDRTLWGSLSGPPAAYRHRGTPAPPFPAASHPPGQNRTAAGRHGRRRGAAPASPPPRRDRYHPSGNDPLSGYRRKGSAPQGVSIASSWGPRYKKKMPRTSRGMTYILTNLTRQRELRPRRRELRRQEPRQGPRPSWRGCGGSSSWLPSWRRRGRLR